MPLLKFDTIKAYIRFSLVQTHKTMNSITQNWSLVDLCLCQTAGWIFFEAFKFDLRTLIRSVWRNRFQCATFYIFSGQAGAHVPVSTYLRTQVHHSAWLHLELADFSTELTLLSASVVLLHVSFDGNTEGCSWVQCCLTQVSPGRTEPQKDGPVALLRLFPLKCSRLTCTKWVHPKANHTNSAMIDHPVLWLQDKIHLFALVCKTCCDSTSAASLEWSGRNI